MLSTVYFYFLLGDGVIDYFFKLIKWLVNGFLEMFGWVFSLDIFNFLDRWIEGGF